MDGHLNLELFPIKADRIANQKIKSCNKIRPEHLNQRKINKMKLSLKLRLLSNQIIQSPISYSIGTIQVRGSMSSSSPRSCLVSATVWRSTVSAGGCARSLGYTGRTAHHQGLSAGNRRGGRRVGVGLGRSHRWCWSVGRGGWVWWCCCSVGSLFSDDLGGWSRRLAGQEDGGNGERNEELHGDFWLVAMSLLVTEQRSDWISILIIARVFIGQFRISAPSRLPKSGGEK